MTTTPAMPEHSVAIKQLTMAANQFDCAAATTNDHKKAAEYLQESREIRASIATLQAQPAAVSDEQIRHDANLPFVEDEQGAEWVTLSPAMFARAVRRVLALRPQAVPMTIKAAPKLIGWRTENFLWETDDADKARNWEPNIGVLPIFEGDPNTKLGANSITDQRKQVAPMDQEAAWEASPVTSDWEAVDAYMQGIADAEAHHGITAQAKEAQK